LGPSNDLLVTSVTAQDPEFKPVQARVGRQRLALIPFAESVFSEHVGFACNPRMERIKSPPVVVVEIR
jgi:hypothetical protein